MASAVAIMEDVRASMLPVWSRGKASDQRVTDGPHLASGTLTMMK